MALDHVNQLGDTQVIHLITFYIHTNGSAGRILHWRLFIARSHRAQEIEIAALVGLRDMVEE